jgi:hypothetical protein
MSRGATEALTDGGDHGEEGVLRTRLSSPASAVDKEAGTGTVLKESSPVGPIQWRLGAERDANSRPPSPPEGDALVTSPAVGASPAKPLAQALKPTGGL